MALVYCVCTYCDYKWVKTLYYKPSKGDIKCDRCKDTNVEISKHEQIDYYASKKPTKKED